MAADVAGRVEFAGEHKQLGVTEANGYLRRGGSIYDLQATLSHSPIETTEIYLDFLDPETRQRAMRRVGQSA